MRNEAATNRISSNQIVDRSMRTVFFQYFSDKHFYLITSGNW